MNGKSEVTAVRAAETHVSWTAIFAGVVIVLVTQITLAMLGLGIGLSSVDPGQARPLAGLGTGSLIWWAISSIIALFLGGWVASRLAGIQARLDGMLHGIVTFGLSTILMVWLLASSVGMVIGGGLSVVRNALMFSGQVAQALPPETAQQLQSQLQQQLQQGGAQGGQQGQQKQQQETKSPQERRREAQAFGGQVAESAATGAIIAFFALLLGAVAAAIGGAAGRTKGPVRV